MKDARADNEHTKEIDMRIYNANCKYSAQAPLRAWKSADLLAQVPKEKVKEFSMKTIPVKVLQEILLARVGTFTDLFGTSEPTYAVDLDFAAQIKKYDIWDEFGEYISEKERKSELERAAREAKKEAERKAAEAREKAKAERKKKAKTEQQALDLGLEERFSKDDTTIYFARVEFRRSSYNEAAGRWTYTKAADPYDAIIFRGVIYAKDQQKHYVKSKGAKVISAQPGWIYIAPRPYRDIILSNACQLESGFTGDQKEDLERLEDYTERLFRVKGDPDAIVDDYTFKLWGWEARRENGEEILNSQIEAEKQSKQAGEENYKRLCERYGYNWKEHITQFLKRDEEERARLEKEIKQLEEEEEKFKYGRISKIC